jgi:phosphate starvation-inducible protein PhoH
MDRLTARRKRVEPLTPNQGVYLDAIDRAKCVVCTGPAGTGKTFLAAARAVEMLRDGKVKRLVITRPLQECGEELGYLPGDLWEKTADMMVPLLDALEEFLGPGELDRMRKDGTLLVVPLAKMRGRTMKEAFVVLDEAQNATFKQLRMFLTRLGKGSKMVVCGDHTQSDLPYEDENSLLGVVERFRPACHRDIRVVQFGPQDVVRDELVRWMDERLTRPPVGGYYSSEPLSGLVTESVRCPDCGRSFGYDGGALTGHATVECFYCRGQVELLDDEGRLDPIALDPDEHVRDPHVTLPN